MERESHHAPAGRDDTQALGLAAVVAANGAVVVATDDLSYPLVDSGQTSFYDADGKTIGAPAEGEAFYGQDATYVGTQPSYTDNGDGTVTDDVTGLTWEQDPSDRPTASTTRRPTARTSRSRASRTGGRPA